MKRFYIDEYNPNELFICMMLTSKCQLDCPYCCSRRSLTYHDTLRDENGNLSSLNKDQIDLIFRCISKAKYDITLNFLGGEPTLSPLINYATEKAHDCDNIKIIELSTNGVTDLRRIKFNDKSRVIFTYHPSEMSKASEIKLLKNTEVCRKNNIEYDVNIMIPRDKSYKAQIDKFISKLKLCNIENIIPVYPYQNNFDIGEDFIDLEKESKFYILNSKKYSLYEVYKNKLNSFKGWKCENMSYIININGNIQQCSSEILGNLYKDAEFFTNINPTQICPYEECNYEGFLRSLKYEDIE